MVAGDADRVRPPAAALGTWRPGLIDPYAATNPAEFFAVVSELFFEQPTALAAYHPALYRVLSSYYRLNPLSW